MRRPRTFGGWLAWASIAVVVAPLVLASMAVFWFVFLRCRPTYYSPGYTEAKFVNLREGMTLGEVKTVIGVPLEIVPQSDGSTLWTYSDRDDDTCDFEMRWVYLRDGKVAHVLRMHWVD